MIKKKVKFEADNKTHIECYKQFLETSNWANGCPFQLEFPWTNVPDMIQNKIVLHVLNVEV